MHLGPLVRAMLRNKVRFGLLALEVALTLAIVANCVSLILDARRELTRPSGFVDEQLMLVTATPFNEAFREDAYRDTVADQDLAALRAASGHRERDQQLVPALAGRRQFDDVPARRARRKPSGPRSTPPTSACSTRSACAWSRAAPSRATTCCATPSSCGR